MNSKYNFVTQYKIVAVCEESLHIGSALGDKSEILINPSTLEPFIQGSSIKGAIADYIEKTKGNELRVNIFGLTEKSKIVLTDGIFNIDKLKTELRPRVKINEKTGTTATVKLKGTNEISGQKFDTEYVSSGSEFSFEIFLYDNYNDVIEEALTALNKGEILLGGQKSNGCGKIKLSQILKKEFNLKNKEDLKAWMSNSAKYTDITKQINASLYQTKGYEIIFEANANKSLLIKSISGFEENIDNPPDSVHIKNGNGDYIIPGSSFKGVIRNQVSTIANYMNIDEKYINNMFGTSDNNKTIAGTIYFSEVILQQQKDKVIPRIKIDKFRASVIESALFSERPVTGKINLKVNINSNNEEQQKIACGLLLLAFRDLSVGVFSIGSSANIGRGFLSNCNIKVFEGTKEIVNIQNDIDNKFIKECLELIEKIRSV